MHDRCLGSQIALRRVPIGSSLLFVILLGGCGAPETDNAESVVERRSAVLSGPTTFNGITSTGNPPDPNGDIGPNLFGQMVNTTLFQFWDKAGNPFLGPQQLGSLWTDASPCANQGVGDPVIVYDHLADRWVMEQIAGVDNFPSTGGAFLCVAISRTGMPGPSPSDWFVYEIATRLFPDYPKLAVWPDGYYVTTYEHGNLGLYVLDRTNLLNGNGDVHAITCAASGSQCLWKFILSGRLDSPVRDTRMLPADLDGPAPPPGTPGIFARTVDDQQQFEASDHIEIYTAAVDWTTRTWIVTQQPDLLATAFKLMALQFSGSLRRATHRPAQQVRPAAQAGLQALEPEAKEDAIRCIGGALSAAGAGAVAATSLQAWKQVTNPSATPHHCPAQITINSMVF